MHDANYNALPTQGHLLMYARLVAILTQTVSLRPLATRLPENPIATNSLR